VTSPAPPANPRRAPDAFDVFFVDLAAVMPVLEQAERETPRLSDDDHARLGKFGTRTADRRAWRAARIATRIALERWAGPAFRRVPFAIAPDGRPHMPYGKPVFSLSHCEGAALIAIAPSGPIGADIEAARPLKVSDARRDRITASAAALSPLQNFPEDPAARFLQAWVRLEALAKANGTGIGRTLTDAGIIGGGEPRVLNVADLAPLGVRDCTVHAGFYAAISASALPEPITVSAFPDNAVALEHFLRT
jgi:4'-phosphopantetheinyl transferase